jgi:UDP-N-acetylmuramoylalanine--D-glutamate ligase
MTLSSKKNTQAKPVIHLSIPDRVLVVGAGSTGVACVRFLTGLGKNVTLTDEKDEKELSGALKALEGISFIKHFGLHDKADFLSHDLIVISPGFVTDHPLLKEARSRGSRVIGEIELASSFIKEPIIAVTGTNGKTTTTTLLGRVFAAAFPHVFVGGNIGEPLINYVIEGRKADYVIAEISSFQLETIESFRPYISILLNITEDHLDRYAAFADYVKAKMAIFENQTESDYALFSMAIRENTNQIRAGKYFFSTSEKVDEGACLEDGKLVVRFKGREFVYDRAISPLLGIHNCENLLSVLLAGHICGIEQSVMESVIRQFKGLSHRVEFVRSIGEIAFYNDSKATNVDATKRAVESIPGDIVLIAGGKDKGGSYEPISVFKDHIKGLVLIGEAAGRIEACLGSHMATYREKSLEEAVKKAFSLSQIGDVVLFSPMCSSFDMFENYKVRGNEFKRFVENL